MNSIIDVHFPGIKKRLVAEALTTFYRMRDVPGLKKKPSTSELLDWLKLLMSGRHRRRDAAREEPRTSWCPRCTRVPAQERGRSIQLFERLAFLAPRQEQAVFFFFE